MGELEDLQAITSADNNSIFTSDTKKDPGLKYPKTYVFSKSKMDLFK